MSSFNRVVLMGNLTRDPELRYTPSNTAVAKFGMAMSSKFKDKQTGEYKENVTFVDVTIFGARAVAFCEYHQKGKPCFIEGELRLDTWNDKATNEKRSKLYVVANSWEFLPSGDKKDRAPAAPGMRHADEVADGEEVF